MDTPEVSPVDDADDEAGETARVHCSTGRLTAAQARVIAAWRKQLTIPDRRWSTANSLPPASSSDCIAAATLDLLDKAAPDNLTLVRYADRVRTELQNHRAGGFPAGSVVSVYLPPSYAERMDRLLAAAQSEHAKMIDEVREQVRTELPGRRDAAARAIRMLTELGSKGVPVKAYRLPAGTIARMAIDRWANKSVPAVVAAAVAYGEQFHTQQHRARKDMGVG